MGDREKGNGERGREGGREGGRGGKREGERDMPAQGKT